MSQKITVTLLVENFVKLHGLPPTGTLDNLVYDHFAITAVEIADHSVEDWAHDGSARVNELGVLEQLRTLMSGGFTSLDILRELGQPLPIIH
jgi:hypothetical protein